MILPFVMFATALSASSPAAAPVMRSVSACGVSADTLHLQWDSALSEDVVVFPQTTLSKSEIDCLARASEMHQVTFQFASPRLSADFAMAQTTTPGAITALQQSREASRNWLSQQGLLEGALRIRAEKGSLEDKARKIEALCGYAPGSILRVTNDAVFVSSPVKITFGEFQKLSALLDVVVPENHKVAVIGQSRP